MGNLAPRMIYVIEAENGLFKVGSSRAALQRVNSIAAHSACRVRLVALWIGMVRDEQVLHEILDAHRQHHEWFRKEGEAARFFEAVFGRGMTSVPVWENHDRATMPSRRKALSVALKRKWADPAYRASMSRTSAAKPSLAEAS